LKVDVVVVTYNSAAVLEQSLRSIPVFANVIVADNGSRDASLAIARSCGATIVENGANLGFGTACNRGAAAGAAELILLLNPDARLMEGALERLLDAAGQHPEAGAFTPRMLRSDGTQSFRSRSFLVAAPRRGVRRPPMPQQDCEIDVFSGAAVLLRRPAFEAVGGFDESIFLYFEDDDLAVRLRAAGWRLRYVHEAVAEHRGAAATSGVSGLSHFKGYHWSLAKAHVADKHGIPLGLGWQIALLKAKSAAARLGGKSDKAAFLAGRAEGFIEARKRRRAGN
jgi:GT2 family glycosyltransferase